MDAMGYSETTINYFKHFCFECVGVYGSSPTVCLELSILGKVSSFDFAHS